MATGADMAQPDTGMGDRGADGTGSVRARNGGTNMARPVGSGGAVSVAEAGTDGRMEVANGEARAQKWQPDDSVYLRLARAQDDVKTITQDATIKVKGRGDSDKEYSYKGVSAAQIVTFAKRALLTNGIVFIPVADRDGVRISGNKTSLWVDGIFVSVNNPLDKFSAGSWGAGADNNDKDCAKAMTNAVKIILSKVLMMSTLEDESDEVTPHEPDRKPREVRNAEAMTDVAIKTWADAFKSAIDGCKSAKQLQKVRAENAHMMTNAGVPQVTKDYFIDKITALEGTLE